MGTYSALTLAYDDIFPESPDRVRFCLSLAAPKAIVLDCGCATGSLARSLAARGRAVEAFDLDAELIGRAVTLAGQEGVLHNRASDAIPGPGTAGFRILDMLAMGSSWPPSAFGALFCFGNTLVHLASHSEVGSFFKAANSLLVPGGTVAVQILNYSRILRLRPSSLPPIEAGRWKLERSYSYGEGPRGTFVDFAFRLEDTVSGIKDSHVSRLLPMVPEDLLLLMKQSGFSSCRVSSSWDGAPLEEDSFMAVFSGRRD